MTDLVLEVRHEVDGQDALSTGAVYLVPTKRRTFDGAVVLPEEISVRLDGTNVPTISIRPTPMDLSWTWTVVVKANGDGKRRYINVPDAPTAQLADLAELDPTTFQPLPDYPTVGEAITAEATAREAAQVTMSSEVARGTQSPAVYELNIPTLDGNPDTTHPAVVAVDGGFGGYRYWMAHTPFPDDARERVNIAASMDGDVWETPEGLINPVAPDAQADPELVLHEGRLYLFYRAFTASTPEIRMRTSDDGVEWTSPSTVYTGAAGDGLDAKSPSVVRSGSGWRMYLSGSGLSLYYVQSSVLGGEYGGRVAVSTPVGVWHHGCAVDRDGTYHLVYGASQSTSPLYYATSADGVSFVNPMPHGEPLLGPYGFGRDDDRVATWYRPSLILHGGSAARAEIFASRGTGAGPTAHHRIHRIPDAALPQMSSINPSARSALFIPADRFTPRLGSPALSTVNGRAVAFAMDQSSFEGVMCTVELPLDWNAVSVEIVWANLATATGDVKLGCWLSAIDAGFVAGAGTDMQFVSTQSTIASAGSQNEYVRTHLGRPAQDFQSSAKRSTAGIYSLRIDRAANDAADTLSGDIGIVGVWLYATSALT